MMNFMRNSTTESQKSANLLQQKQSRDKMTDEDGIKGVERDIIAQLSLTPKTPMT